MDSYKEYQKARRARLEAQSWAGNKDKIDSQCHTPYMLHGVTFSAQYCGQSYAGANNYHKSPDAFNKAMAEVIKARFSELSDAAMKLLERDERNALISCESELQALQRVITDAKAESEPA